MHKHVRANEEGGGGRTIELTNGLTQKMVLETFISMLKGMKRSNDACP